MRFRKRERKDDVMQKELRRFKKSGKSEGVVFVGVAPEKVRVPRTTRKHLDGGGTIPWIICSTAMVNVYYFYCYDQDFGPFFLKFCSYFPYPAKLCLNGHEYLKCQLQQRGIAFEALDNGLLSCADVKAAQRIADGLTAPKINWFFRKWLAQLPHPDSAQDQAGGGLRTETTINNTYDFRVGRLLKNLAALRQIGFAANRRVLEVERLSHDCQIDAAAFEQLQKPAEVDGQHASALPFGQERVQALLTVLVMFCLPPDGFRNRQLRPLLAQLLGLPQAQITAGRMSYDLRRLRLHRIIERIPKTQRYRLSGAHPAIRACWYSTL